MLTLIPQSPVIEISNQGNAADRLRALARAKKLGVVVLHAAAAERCYYVSSASTPGAKYFVALNRLENGSVWGCCHCQGARRGFICIHLSVAYERYQADFWSEQLCLDCGDVTQYTVAHADTDYCQGCLNAWDEQRFSKYIA